MTETSKGQKGQFTSIIEVRITQARTEKITERAETVPNCPQPLIAWLAVVPDPCTGLDQPLEDSQGNRREWIAADRKAAETYIRPLLNPRQRHIAGIVAKVDWDSRLEKQRAKLTSDSPGSSPGQGINPRRRCWHCGERTHTRDARYCDVHRYKGSRRKQRTA